MNSTYSQYKDDARFVALGLILLLLVNPLASFVPTVEGWMITTTPIIRLHGRPSIPTARLFQPHMLSSTRTTQLEAKGKNKPKNRNKNGEDGEDEKIRADGKRIGRRRKSVDPSTSSSTKKKPPKASRRVIDGAVEPTKAIDSQPLRVGTLDQLQTKRCWLRLETNEGQSPPTQPLLPLDICLVEIQDKDWWNSHEEPAKVLEESVGEGKPKDELIEKKMENNPFGARVWPPSLALAEFLSDYLRSLTTTMSTTADPTGSDDTTTTEQQDAPSSYHVLEIGCGTGLVSMAAALCGAKVLATDVAPITLRLLQQGWSETCAKQRKHREKMLLLQDMLPEEGETFEVMDGNLKMKLLDLTLPDPLPWSEIGAKGGAGGEKRILVASAVLYEKSLAVAMARCCFKACYEDGAWVILADDDTGLREGGRELFEQEWERLVESDSRKKKKKKSPWVRTTVEQKTVFGWVNKQVQLLHLNHPSSLQFD